MKKMNTKDHVVSGNVSTERALDLALEALEYWAVRDEFNKQTSEAITAIKQARSAPVQEPAIKQGWDVDTLLDKPAAQRPVALPHKWVHATEWRGLTDEEVKHMLELFVIPPHHIEMVVQAIEAKLKEKNQ
jgi:hypothetical protein